MSDTPGATVSPVSKAQIAILILGPLLFLLIIFAPPPGMISITGWRVAAVATLMVVFWITEALPIPATALLPVVLFPLLGVFDIKQATSHYAHPLIFLFLGGFIMALAMQKWNLHKRIALKILRITGTHADGIIGGFMIATAFLSMWMSNTATTVLMITIGISILQLLLREQDVNGVRRPENQHRFALCLMLGIAYAANIGGTATLIGTPPNALLAAFLDDLAGIQITFFQWFMIGFPFAVILLFLCWFFLVKLIYPSKLGRMPHADEVIRREMKEIGPMSRGEIMVAVLFFLMAGLWMFKPFLSFIKLSDAGIAMTAAVLCFALPVSLKQGQFILTWQDTRDLPWGILILFGGGLALASGMEAGGLIDLIGARIAGFDAFGIFGLMILATTVVLFMTEMMGNIALMSIMLPVLAGIAMQLGIPVLMLAVPATLAASCAFMLPMATPPNAIVFASGHIKIREMFLAGIFINLLSIAVITAMVYLVARPVFGL